MVKPTLGKRKLLDFLEKGIYPSFFANTKWGQESFLSVRFKVAGDTPTYDSCTLEARLGPALQNHVRVSPAKALSSLPLDWFPL